MLHLLVDSAFCICRKSAGIFVCLLRMTLHFFSYFCRKTVNVSVSV